MYEITKNVIMSKNYDLSDMLQKLSTLWLNNSITEEQYTELVTLARNNAVPENSYADLQTQISTLVNMQEVQNLEISNLRERVIILEGGEVPPEPVPEEWPLFVKPQGAHDAYYTGDKITYNGKHYICIMPEGAACSWPPDEYPQGWEEKA